MAKAKTTGTALELTSDEAKDLAALEELGDFFDSVGVDGMADVGGEDIKLSVRLFNLGGLDKQGNQQRKNTFFDTVSEETQDTITCVLLLTQKTLRWDEYDNAEKRTDILCASPDRITGRMADGTTRPCEGCPDSGWFKKPDGSPMRKCGEVHNVIAIESETQRPFIVRFKKTSLKAFRNYLMRHHFGARKTASGRGNVPLFAFQCTLSLVMHESGNYALPVFDRGPVLSRDDVVAMSESAKAYLEMMGEVLTHTDSQESKHTTDERDGSLNSDDFAD